MPFYDRLSAHPMERTGPIAAHWRGRIVRGSLAPGAVFPTRLELTRRHRTTRATIDRVIKNLQAAGFIESRRGAGARVVPHPPHLCTFGLVFRGNPGRTEPHDTQRWTFLDEAFCRAARGLSRPPAVRFTIFQDVPSDDDGGACPALLDAIRGERLAGLILPTPGYWRGALTLEQLPLPVATLGMGPRAGVHTLVLDNAAFLDRALECLAARGRRRIAVLGSHEHRSALGPAGIAAAMDTLGLSFRPSWMIPLSAFMPETGRAVTRLLFEFARQRRPDGLIITDDHLLDQVAAGLAAAGVTVGDDLDVVSHCNWPAPPACELPVVFLGYDIPEVTRQAVEAIRRRRGGQPVAATTPVQPVLFSGVSPATLRLIQTAPNPNGPAATKE